MSVSTPRRRSSPPTVVPLASLPPEIQGAAWDAAVAEANDYALRFGKAKPSLDLDARSPRTADLLIKRRGGIIPISPSNNIQVDTRAFSEQMSKLEAYMRRERLTALQIPTDTKAETLVHSLVVGAVEALFSSPNKS